MLSYTISFVNPLTFKQLLVMGFANKLLQVLHFVAVARKASKKTYFSINLFMFCIVMTVSIIPVMRSH